MNRGRWALKILGILLLILDCTPLFGDDTITVTEAVERNRVFRGESFIFQVQIQGSETVKDYPEDDWETPGLTGDFSVQFLGGSTNSSRTVTIVNGQRSVQVHLAYVLSYRLTPNRTGDLIIPPLSFKVDGKTVSTRPVPVTVKEPEENDFFKVRLSLSGNTAYVGEPIVFTVVWYIGMDVRDFDFSIPFFKRNEFSFIHPEPGIKDPAKYIRIPVAGSEVVAERGRGTLDGNTYTTLTFKTIVIPEKPGAYYIPRAIVAIRAQTGTVRNRDPFEDFFFGDTLEMENFVVPSNSLEITVKELPLRGKPDDFQGHVGAYTIETSAEPREVFVGDPVTLTIRISGPPYIRGTAPPDLRTNAALVRDFHIPSEMSAGREDQNSIVFTQTIRPVNEGITEIPSITLPYFDTVTERYRTARSGPIPVTVKPAGDYTVLGGSTGPELPAEPPAETGDGGIRHLYKEKDVLISRDYGFSFIHAWDTLIPLAVPPLVFVAALVLYLARKRIRKGGGDGTWNCRDMHTGLMDIARKDDVPPEERVAAMEKMFREYFSLFSGKGAGGFVPGDVPEYMETRGFGAEDIEKAEMVMKTIDFFRFGGVPCSMEDLRNLVQDMLRMVTLLETRRGDDK